MYVFVSRTEDLASTNSLLAMCKIAAKISDERIATKLVVITGGDRDD